MSKSVVCPRCQGALEIDRVRGIALCPTCQAEFKIKQTGGASGGTPAPSPPTTPHDSATRQPAEPEPDPWDQADESSMGMEDADAGSEFGDSVSDGDDLASADLSEEYSSQPKKKKKKKKAQSTQEKPSGRPQWNDWTEKLPGGGWLIAAGIGLLVLAIGGFALVGRIASGIAGSGDPVVDENGKVTFSSSTTYDDDGQGRVVEEKPVAASAEAKTDLKPALPPAGESTAPQQAAAADESTAEPTWSLGFDPTEGHAALPELGNVEHVVGKNVYDFVKVKPVFASAGGPYVLLAPARDATFRGGQEAPPEVLNSEILNLMTGQIEPGFDGNAIWYALSHRLSPDGNWLVGHKYGRISADPMPSIEPPRELHVWARGSAEPKHSWESKGLIAWCEFVSPYQLLMIETVVEGEQTIGRLIVWDINDGKISHEVKLPGPVLPSSMMAAIHPNPRLVAIVGIGQVMLVDWTQQKLVGTLAIPSDPETEDPLTDSQFVYGFGFSSDGRELMMTALRGHRERQNSYQCLYRWDITRGQVEQRVQFPSEPALSGPLRTGPLPGTVWACGGYFESGFRKSAMYHKPGARGDAILFDQATGGIVATLLQSIAVIGADGKYLLNGSSKDEPFLTVVGYESGGKDQGFFAPRPNQEPPPDELVFSQQIDLDRLRPNVEKFAEYSWGRPPELTVDRSRITVVPSVAPEKIEALPVIPEVIAPPIKVPMRPWAITPTHIAAIDMEARRIQGRREIGWLTTWRTIDRQKPDPSAQRVHLYSIHSRALPPSSTMGYDEVDTNFRPVADLSIDGKRFALVDPQNPGRVDTWDQSLGHLAGWSPHPRKEAITSIHWTADGSLVTVAGGHAMLWSVESGKVTPSWEVPGDYTGRGDAVSSRAWLAIGTKTGGVDILDLATGKCLGRCRTGSLLDPIAGIAVSPDGQRIAATSVPIKSSPGERPETHGASPEEAPIRICLIWEPGQSKTVVSAPLICGPELGWVSSELLRAANGLFSVKTGYRFQGIDAWPQNDWFAHDAGKVFINIECEKWQSPPHLNDAVLYAIGGRDPVNASPLFDPKQKILGPGDITFKLDVDLGHTQWSQYHIDVVSKELTDRGFSLGPDGWTYEVRFLVGQLDEEMIVGGRTMYLPIVDVICRVLDPQGREYERHQRTMRFAQTASRYYRKTTEKDLKGQPGYVEVTDHYDFPGNVRTSVIDEILQTYARSKMHVKIDTPILSTDKELRTLIGW